MTLRTNRRDVVVFLVLRRVVLSLDRRCHSGSGHRAAPAKELRRRLLLPSPWSKCRMCSRGPAPWRSAWKRPPTASGCEPLAARVAGTRAVPSLRRSRIRPVLPRELPGVYAEAQSLARQIAFCNPRLDFDQLLFLKRHDSVGVYHMCDQFYGCNAKPGGGLFVLINPFSDQPAGAQSAGEFRRAERSAAGAEAGYGYVSLAGSLV